MDESGANWVVETGQIWKLYVALAGFVAALACFTAAIFSLSAVDASVGRWTGTGVALAAASFGWLVSTLRCPHCRTRLVWTMLKASSLTTWLIDLAGLDVCPVCRRSLHRSAR